MHLFMNLLCVIFLLAATLASRAVGRVFVHKIFVYLYWAISLSVLGYFLFHWNTNFGGVWNHHRQYAFGVFVSWLVFLVIVSCFVLVELLWKSGRFLLKITPKETQKSRRNFLHLMGLGVASVPFLGMIYGMLHGKYNFQVVRQTLFFDDLPDAFDGYQITHISDIHAGSFDDQEKVKYGIDLINQQQSDVVFFTGDLVNNYADEMLPWTEIFSQIKAPDEVFSVLGNHDYGDYVQWENQQLKEDNNRKIKQIQTQMGYHLLLNNHHFIKRNGQQIAVVGVENWGKGFVKKGNLQKALLGVSPDDFCILLSHDPTHWQYKVKNFPKKIQLTLSGHTHGMQFGVEIPNWIKWSPIQWKYKYWAGIYKENDRYLNVNKGFGFLGFPGRVGMPPEISVITLRKTNT